MVLENWCTAAAAAAADATMTGPFTYSRMLQQPYWVASFVWPSSCFPCKTVEVMKIAWPYSMAPVQKSFSLCYVMSDFVTYSVYFRWKIAGFVRSERSVASNGTAEPNNKKKIKEKNRQINKSETKTLLCLVYLIFRMSICELIYVYVCMGLNL